MPIPVVIAAGAVMGAKGLGMGGAAYVGYQGASYVYNGVRDWIDPSRVTKRTNEALASLSKERQEKESERMHNLDEVVTGIKERKQQLENQSTMQQTRLQEVVLGVDADRTEMHEQALQLTQVHEELEQSAQTQEELIARLQHELHEKMAALDDARQQLISTTVRFEQKSQELTEAKEQITASKNELTQIKEELASLSTINKEKDQQIIELDKKIHIMSTQAKENHVRLKTASIKIEDLTKGKEVLSTKLDEANALIETLTEQLEQAQEDKQTRTTSPSFFRR